jgi:hypothetical protein
MNHQRLLCDGQGFTCYQHDSGVNRHCGMKGTGHP